MRKNRFTCKGFCEVWKKDMSGSYYRSQKSRSIHFIRHMSLYAVADRCNICKVWYPKTVFGSKCPCCGCILRTHRVRLNNQRYTHPLKSNEEVAKIIQENIDKGWTLINQDALQKSIVDYEIMCDMEEYRIKKLRGIIKPLFLFKERTDDDSD